MPQDLADSALGAGIETAAAMAAAPGGGGASRRALPPGVCPHCHSALRGPFCHVCGQDTRSLRRPLWTLFAEGFEGLFGVDGRIWRTVIPLMMRPGHVTRRYLAGIRQPYIAPVRLFLAASLVLFLAILLASHGGKGMIQTGPGSAGEQALDREKAEKAKAAIARAREELSTIPQAQAGNVLLDQVATQVAQEKADSSAGAKTGKPPVGQTLVCAVRKWMLPEDLGPACTAFFAKTAGDAASAPEAGAKADPALDVSVNVDVNNPKPPPVPLAARRRFVDNLQKAVSSPGDYQQALNRWAPRLAFLLAPAYGLLLAAVFFWRRDLYMYDHMVTALHFQSFVFLFIALLIPVGLVFGPQIAGPVFLVWSNTYLYLILRRLYGASRIGALVRILVLDISYLVLLLLAFLLLLILGVVFV